MMLSTLKMLPTEYTDHADMCEQRLEPLVGPLRGL